MKKQPTLWYIGEDAYQRMENVLVKNFKVFFVARRRSESGFVQTDFLSGSGASSAL